MASPAPPRPRLLFVLSHDFGELSAAMYLVTGQPFEVVLAMPPRLHETQAHLPGARSVRYESCDDLLALMDSERPDVVLLFSGYLLALGGSLSLDAIGRVTGRAKEMGCRLVTSDPFLGLAGRIDESTFSPAHPRRDWLMEHFAHVARVLCEVTHLYPTDGAGLAGKCVSFHNPTIAQSTPSADQLRRDVADQFPVDPSRPRWLFVLSAEDYGGLINRHGKAPADSLLLAKLRETAACGRQGVLVAPGPCVDSIAEDLGRIDGAAALPFCPFGVFRSLLLEAEYAFYWNILSNTILTRAMGGLGVLFFDPGHMMRAIPALHELAMQRYYAGASLSGLDIRAELAAETLAKLADHHREALAPALTRMRALADPAGAVRAIGQEA